MQICNLFDILQHLCDVARGRWLVQRSSSQKHLLLIAMSGNSFVNCDIIFRLSLWVDWSMEEYRSE